MSDNISMVYQFITAWSRLDAEELSKFFLDNGVYHNMPAQPIRGREAIRDFIKSFTRFWKSTDWEIISIVAQNDFVVAERIDHTIVKGVRVDLPCCGVFEIKDGHIAVWRDYFDMAPYTNALVAQQKTVSI